MGTREPSADPRVEIPGPAVVVLVAPSGAGKSTWAAANFDPDEIVSSDRLRGVVGHAEDDLDATDDAFALLDAIVAARSRRRLTTVVDTLGLDPAKRLGYRSVAAEHGLPCVAVTFPVEPETCRARNRLRPHPVPAPALKQQLSRWSAANDEVATEGFDAVVEAATVRHVDAPGTTSSPRAATTASSATTAAEQPTSGAAVGGIDVGLHISAFPWDDVATGLRATATTAEDAGVRSLWVMDHVRQIPQVGRDWDPMLEAYAALSWMAGATERVRLGALVTPVTFRNVGLLAKAIATLDVLSGGRAVCGIGLGWYEREHRAYGLDFPSTADRYQLLEDALGALPKLWGPGAKPFAGAVLDLPETIGYPRPIQARIPILVGGGGERRTLRLAARYADAVNVMGPLDVVRRKIEVLHEHCAAVDRDPAEIRVTVLAPTLLGADRRELRGLVEHLRPRQGDPERYAASVGAATVEDATGRFAALAGVGVDEVIVSLPDLGLETGAADDPVTRLGAVLAATGSRR